MEHLFIVDLIEKTKIKKEMQGMAHLENLFCISMFSKYESLSKLGHSRPLFSLFSSFKTVR